MVRIPVRIPPTHLVVGDHPKKSSFSLVMTIALAPCCAQRLLLHQEEVAHPGVHLVEGSGINRFLVEMEKVQH